MEKATRSSAWMISMLGRVEMGGMLACEHSYIPCLYATVAFRLRCAISRHKCVKPAGGLTPKFGGSHLASPCMQAGTTRANVIH